MLLEKRKLIPFLKSYNLNLYILNFFHVFLGNPSEFPDKFKNKYDVIVCAGVIFDGHCGPEIFDEMLLALKKGGYAIFSSRAAFLKANCEERAKELVDTGKWEFISKEEYVRYTKISEKIEGFETTEAMLCV